MKAFTWIAVLTAFTTQINATQCTSPSPNQNKLIKRSLSFTDTSPIFKTNNLFSFKPNQLDIDNDFIVNYYGNKLTLKGNTWKMLRFNEPYLATPNTILEFEFRSTGEEAQINGIAPKTYGASGFHSDHFYQVYGTQSNNHNQSYHDYSGNKWKKYQIPIWNDLDYTPEKRIDAFIFAGKNFGGVNQKVMYKNIRLIEGVPSYQLPTGFQHSNVQIVQTASKDINYHIYKQTIVGPDYNTYPVSGGHVTQVFYQPQGSGIPYLLAVNENYYENICWNDPINFNENQATQQSLSNLQNIAHKEPKPEFNVMDSGVSIKSSSEIFFDPDYTQADLITRDPSFITATYVNSNRSGETYYERIKNSDLTVTGNGFFTISAQQTTKNVDCNNPKTGRDTWGNCYDLTGKTKPGKNNDYIAQNVVSEVYDDVEDINIPLFLVNDQDDKWSEDTDKQQTTELLINMEITDKYFNEVIGQSYETITGHKLKAAINNIYSNSGAKFDSDDFMTKYQVYNYEDAFNYRGTWTRDPSIVTHEFMHGVVYTWYGLSMSTVEKQGCAINEAIGDIMGTGAKRHHKGYYQANFAVDVYESTTPKPQGLRNLKNPSSTGGESVYIGNNENIPGDCFGPPTNPPPSCDDWNVPGVPCPYNWEGYSVISRHNIGNIITHLYHLMVTGGFNEDGGFEPDSFGVSADEVFTHKGAEKIFYNAIRDGGSIGHSMKFCELRDRMISLSSLDASIKTALQQAWKHVYKDIQTICPLPAGIDLLKPEMVIKLDNDEISDNELINFGAVEHGSPVTKTFRVVNTGGYMLRMINPILSNSSFTQSGLQTDIQVKVKPGVDNHLNTEYAEIEITFNADAANTGFNQGTLTFETNLPNGTEDQHFFTLHLRATSIEPQNNADAYEEDDSVQTMKVFDRTTTTIQHRNFEDDAIDYVDWIGLGGLNDSTCYMEFSSLGVNVDICVDRYRQIDGLSAGSFCGINNSTQNNQVSLWLNQWSTYFKIRNTNSQSVNTEYSISIICPPLMP